MIRQMIGSKVKFSTFYQLSVYTSNLSIFLLGLIEATKNGNIYK